MSVSDSPSAPLLAHPAPDPGAGTGAVPAPPAPTSGGSYLRARLEGMLNLGSPLAFWMRPHFREEDMPDQHGKVRRPRGGGGSS